MAFNCTSHRPECFHEIATQHDDKWVVLTSIGYDTDGPLTYYFIVHTYPSEESTEFAFCITEVNNSNGLKRTIYDSSASNAIIPSACRQHISAILQDFTRKLISSSRPEHFFMETYCVNLPAAALVKYTILCQIFSSLGYTITPIPTQTGKNKWVMKLLA